MPAPSENNADRTAIGWREWARFPDLDVDKIAAKIDSGAKSAVLGAEDIQKIRTEGKDFVSFRLQHGAGNRQSENFRAPFVGKRRVRSSNGIEEERLVIATRIELGGKIWKTEFTLTDRQAMDFQLLLGRQALGRKFLINPAASWLLGR